MCVLGEREPRQYPVLVFFKDFIYYGCAGSLLLCGLSFAAVSWGFSSWRCAGFSLPWLLLVRSAGSKCVGFSSCTTGTRIPWLLGSRAWASLLQGMWDLSGSSWTRDRTCISCIAGRFFTTEPPVLLLGQHRQWLFGLTVYWLYDVCNWQSLTTLCLGFLTETDYLLDQTLVEHLWVLCSTWSKLELQFSSLWSPVLARFLLSQFSQNLPPLVNDLNIWQNSSSLKWHLNI